ncbi:hypothetical protein BGX33_010767 [Mortierella sp. NVP41]|nr:hypothetical protein BGX33_010767 [Mortierella sp. NVP41]
MSTPSSKPTVLIVGAGLGGLMLGALLERASIPYAIFERTSTVKPLGSALLIGPSLMPLFAQLGIEEEFIALGKRTMNSAIRREGAGPLLTVDYQTQTEYSGYYSYLIARPTLYNLVLKLVPPHKILFSKRVLTIGEEDGKVMIQTADNCAYEGDVLVGADGAYSAVRQRLYERLKKEDKLPKSDQQNLPFHSTCLVGQTKVLDPADFPEFQHPSLFNTLGKDKPFSWMVLPTAQNTFCWMVIHHLDKVSSKVAEEHRFREYQNAQWGPYAAQTMCDETKHFPLSIGNRNLTMGDLYDWTPKELISKVMLEEKVFQTWYSGRTILLGDGAVLAMHDALALANLLYALPSDTAVEIERIFAAYKAERMGPTIDVFKSSQMASKFMEKGLVGALFLFTMKKLPPWIFDIATRRMILNRPQIGWMQQIESKGSIPAVVSPSTEKARQVFERNNAVAI